MLIIRNLNLISVQSWTYLNKVSYTKNLLGQTSPISLLEFLEAGKVGVFTVSYSNPVFVFPGD